MNLADLSFSKKWIKSKKTTLPKEDWQPASFYFTIEQILYFFFMLLLLCTIEAKSLDDSCFTLLVPLSILNIRIGISYSRTSSSSKYSQVSKRDSSTNSWNLHSFDLSKQEKTDFATVLGVK